MELRKDYILDHWTIISKTRSLRPHQLKAENFIHHDEKSPHFFCPGNEEMTPPETGRLADGKSWSMRYFPNKFAAVKPVGKYKVETHNDFFTFSDGFGRHEVIVETPNHDEKIWDFDKTRLVTLLKLYASRINDLDNQPHIEYVTMFKNHGIDAGTSIVHSHSQAIALAVVPPYVREKLDAIKRYDSCPYCKIIDIEKTGDRRVFENDGVVAFCPYASQYNLELWIFPKSHYKTLNDFNEETYNDLADCLLTVFPKLKELNASFNMMLFYSPGDNDLHFHIEIKPRIAKWAGFELGSGITINAFPPESAAAFYRGENLEEDDEKK